MTNPTHTFLASVRQEGTLTILGIAQGVLDSSTADSFRDEVQGFLKPKNTIVLDMSLVEFVDSAGLAAILSCVRRIADVDGTLQICSPTPTVRRLFELVRFHRVVDIFNDPQEAIRTYRASSGRS